jgi:hypothetical protein
MMELPTQFLFFYFLLYKKLPTKCNSLLFLLEIFRRSIYLKLIMNYYMLYFYSYLLIF